MITVIRRKRKVEILIGSVYGKLCVIEKKGVGKYGHILWLCRCECGNEKVVASCSLNNGGVRSCGCLRNETNAKRQKRKMPEYDIWSQIIQRCNNKNNKSYKNYGGRGITVCESWLKFDNFYKDMGDRPSKRHSIDRINVDGNYEKSNCKWATATEQNRNKRMLKNTVSGRVGVHWDKRKKKWVARIRANRKEIHLGYFNKLENAIEAREDAELKYWNRGRG